MQLICPELTYVSGAGVLLKNTCTLASVVETLPVESSCRLAGVSGPKLTESGTDAEELALPLVGLTESHPDGVLVALAVKLAADEPDPVAVIVWADGTVVPAA